MEEPTNNTSPDKFDLEVIYLRYELIRLQNSLDKMFKERNLKKKSGIGEESARPNTPSTEDLMYLNLIHAVIECINDQKIILSMELDHLDYIKGLESDLLKRQNSN